MKAPQEILLIFAPINSRGLIESFFFGGEPLLNWKIIDLIYTLFKERSCSQKFYQPSFSIATNGTLISDQIFSIMRPLQNLTLFSIILVFEHYWLTRSQYF